MLRVSQRVAIPEHEMEVTAVRAQGPGGQHVNKVASAVQLRFDIHASSLPEGHKRRLLRLRDRRVGKDGVIVIKAQSYRDQPRNREAARERLVALIQRAAAVPKKRIPTTPGRAAREARLADKRRRGQRKALRGRLGARED